MPNFMKTIQVRSELFSTDRQTYVTVLIAALSDIAKAPKKWHYYKNLRKTIGLKNVALFLGCVKHP